MRRRGLLLVVLAAVGLLALAGTALAAAVSQTFSSPSNTGTTGTFVVPRGVHSIHVVAVGAKGGDDPFTTNACIGIPYPNRTGGFGAKVSADLAVTPGQTLYVYVGGNGVTADPTGAQVKGGANGGGDSGANTCVGGGAGSGGGGSDVRTVQATSSGSQTSSLNSRLIVAGGGGGAADASNGGTPGNGNGGDAGQPGPSGFGGAAAQPGTQGAGGAGGQPNGGAGTQGQGGTGGVDCCFQGGGGGGGLYGGGGGGSVFGQPGAGGSSYVTAAATGSSIGTDTTGAPSVTISYALPSATTGGATGVTKSAATLHGNVNPAGQPTSYRFQFGLTERYGKQTPNRSAGSGSSNRSVSQAIKDLKPNTVYHYRIVATNATGTTFGQDRTVKTKAAPPQPGRCAGGNSQQGGTNGGSVTRQNGCGNVQAGVGQTSGR